MSMNETSDERAAVRLKVATIIGRTRLESCKACCGSGLRWSSGAAWRCRACPQDMTRPQEAVGLGKIVTAEPYTVDDMLGWLRAQGHTVEDVYDDGGMLSFVLGDELGGVRSTSFVGLLEAAVVAVGDGEPDGALMMPAAVTQPVADDAALWAHAERLADVLLGVKVDHLDAPRVGAVLAEHAVMGKARQG